MNWKRSHQPALKTACLVLSAALVFGSGMSVSAEENTGGAEADAAGAANGARSVSSAYQKSETVYVNLDPSGKPYDQIVVNWLHSDTPGVTIEDRTTLRDIENVKGDETPRRSGNNVSWDLDGTDLYYRGRTDGELPVSVDITYKLDGKTMSAEEIAGKSGKLEMTVNVKNNLRRSVMIGGEGVTMYVPLSAAVALSMPEETFHNVDCPDGTVQSDGNVQAVALVAMPGLEDSLNLGGYDLPGFGDIDFPETFTLTADVDEFELGPIGIVVTASIPELDKIDAAEDIDDMRTDLIDLQSAQNDLDAWDPSRRTRSLFTSPAHTAGARVLVNDIFEFYDQDVAILDILPKYTTEENIDLYDRVSKTMDDVDIDELLDSEAVDKLIDRLTEKNVENIRSLLNDYDTIKDLDCDELDDLLEEMQDLLDDYEEKREIFETYEVLLKYSDSMFALADALESSGLEEYLDENVIDTVIGGIAGTKVPAAVRPDRLEDAIYVLGIDGATTRSPKQVETIKTAFAMALEKRPNDPSLNALDGFVSTLGTSGVIPPQISGGLAQVLGGVKSTVEDEMTSAAEKPSQSLKGLLRDVKNLKGQMDKELGGNTEARLADAMDFTKEMAPRLEKMLAAAEDLAKHMHYKDGTDDLVDELRRVIRDLDANKGTINALRDLMDEYDADQFDTLREHWPELKDDIKEVRPILRDLRDDLKDPVLDRSLHAMPQTVDVLLRMKDDLFEQREISEILRDSLAQDKVDTATRMFGTFDRLQEKGSVDKYVGQVDDADLLLERKDAIVELSNQYRIYTDAADEADTALKFVMKTDEIEKPEAPQADEEPAEEKKGITAWVKGVIGKLTGK